MSPVLLLLTLFLAWLLLAILLRRQIPYFLNVYTGFDRFVNALLAGDPAETISSRLGKALHRSRRPVWARALCWALDKIDPGHCEESIDQAEGEDAVPVMMALVCLVWIVFSVLAFL